MGLKNKKTKTSPGQQRLPWDNWQAGNDEIHEIARKFVMANALNPEIVGSQFR
jgi:putative transposase